MCISDFLRTKAKGMGPTEQVTIDRDWIEWLLEHHACECGTHPEGENLPSPASLEGYSVVELEALFDKKSSTIRSWCARGVFGDPSTLKPNGRGWHVPEDRVSELREKLSRGWRITSKGLGQPENMPLRDTPEKGRLGPVADPLPSSELKQRGVPRRSSRKYERRHNGWRQHMQ